MDRAVFSNRAFIVQGWTLLFLLFLSIFFFELAVCVIDGDLSMFRTEAAQRTLRLTVGLLMLHAFVPMLVCVLDGKWLRWSVFGITVVLTVVLIGHQIAHLLAGEKPFGVFQLLDVFHHLLGAWVSVVAWRWAREQNVRSLAVCGAVAGA